MPSLTYAGITLLGDYCHQVEDFMERWCSLDDRPRSANFHLPSSVEARTGGRTIAMGLPTPNYPEQIKPRINQLYWPTGASRWATFYGLCDLSSLLRIKANTESGSTQRSATLFIDDGSNGIAVEMYMLDPVPVLFGENYLYVIPLVDKRYWWQYKDVSLEFKVSPGDGQVTTTWSEIFDQIFAALGETLFAVRGLPNADLLTPDRGELERKHENAAVLLDAVAHSCGLRIVVGYYGVEGGVIYALDPEESDVRFNESIDPAIVRFIAGGRWENGITPKSFQMVFRRNDSDDCREVDHWASGADGDSFSVANTKYTVFSSAWADFQSAADDAADPANKTKLDTLRDVWFQRWFAFRSKGFDYTFPAVQNFWKQSGYDDAMIVSYGRESSPTLRISQPSPDVPGQIVKEYGHSYYTRVISHAPNFGVLHQLSQDPEVDPPSCSQTRIRTEVFKRLYDEYESNFLGAGGNFDGVVLTPIKCEGIPGEDYVFFRGGEGTTFILANEECHGMWTAHVTFSYEADSGDKFFYKVSAYGVSGGKVIASDAEDSTIPPFDISTSRANLPRITLFAHGSFHFQKNEGINLSCGAITTAPSGLVLIESAQLTLHTIAGPPST